jgi:hypothetical protein
MNGPESPDAAWASEREALLGRRISELGLTLRGSPLERLVEQLHAELAQRGLAFRPPVYLSDEWGCPDGVPVIGVPFYLADARLRRIERERTLDVESDDESMRYLRHEAGHAFNYAYRFHDRADWHQVFGPYSRPYRDRYQVDPFSRAYVRHILGWYAQKHPDEDFAETFAVWLTPGLDWRQVYAGWPAIRKLEYVDRVLSEVADTQPRMPTIAEDDLPVEAMHFTVAEHFAAYDDPLPLEDERHFDGDLRAIFAAKDDEHVDGAGDFVRAHRRELVGRIAYWTGESPTTVRSFVDFLAGRAEALGLVRHGREASTLIELTAFGTAVMMNHRYTSTLDGVDPERDRAQDPPRPERDAPPAA